ncbi:MAG: DUF4126 domain-containing protein [Leptolyngbyaceae cyanobacterium]
MDVAAFLVALCLGLGLSAASGFRIFIPPLAMSLAAHSGMVTLSPDWQWVGSYPAMITLGAATAIEVLAYFVPWVSNGLDAIEVFAAPVAGTLLTASSLSMVGDLNPVLVWTVAAVAGGGTAEIVEGATSVTRLVASSVSGGLGGPVVSTGEMLSATVLSLLAILVPVVAFGVVVFLLVYSGHRIRKWWRRRNRPQKRPGL